MLSSPKVCTRGLRWLSRCISTYSCAVHMYVPCGSARRRRTKPRGGTAPFQPDFLEARRAAATRAADDVIAAWARPRRAGARSRQLTVVIANVNDVAHGGLGACLFFRAPGFGRFRRRSAVA